MVELYYLKYVRDGAKLSESEKTALREIDDQLAGLGPHKETIHDVGRDHDLGQSHDAFTGSALQPALVPIETGIPICV